MFRRHLAAVLVVAGLAALAALLHPCGSVGDAPDRATSTGAIAPDAPHDARQDGAVNRRATPAEEPATSPRRGESPAESTTTIVVRVLAAEDRSPLSGSTAVIEDANDRQHRATTDAAGSARFAGLVPGRTLAWAAAEGRLRSGYDEITTSVGRDTTVDIALERGVLLEGLLLDDTDDRPVAGAAVSVDEGGWLDYVSSGVWAPPLGRLATGPDGRFGVRVPPDVIVTAKTTARGYVGSARSVRVAAGGSPAPHVILRLERDGVLRGTVRDAEGGAVTGATVFAVPGDERGLLADPTVEYNSGGRALSARTDARGLYELEGLVRGGSYVAFAMAKGWARSVAREGVLVTETAPAAAADFALRRLGALHVRVLDADGQPAKGAAVTVASEVRRGPPPGKVGEGGTVHFDSLEPFRWDVIVHVAGFPEERTAADVAEGATDEVTVRLARGVVVSGTVVDDLGAPIAGAEVWIHRPWGREGRGLTSSEGRAKTGPDGKFQVEGLRTGPHVLHPHASHHAAARDLPVEAPAADVRVVLPRCGTAKLHVVLPPNGAVPAPLFLERETWRDMDTKERLALDGSYDDFGDGRFTLQLAPGRCRVRIGARDYGHVVTPIFTLAPGETVDLGKIALDPGVEVGGRVEDLAGLPVAGARVTTGGSQDAPEARFAATSADGSFRLPHLSPGLNAIEVRAAGFVPATVRVDVRAGVPVVVRLSRGALLRATVVDARGQPLPGVYVELLPLGGGDAEKDYATTDVRGLAQERLAAGRHRVTALGSGPPSATESIEDLVRGPSADVEASEGGEIAVRLVVR